MLVSLYIEEMFFNPLYDTEQDIYDRLKLSVRAKFAQDP